MLAPRRKLWSTPSPAVDIALTFADLDNDDVVYDVGCGDGRVLIQMASLSMPLAPSSSSSSLEVSTAIDGDTSNCCNDQNNMVGVDSITQARHQNDNPSPQQPQQSHPQQKTHNRHHHCHRFIGIEISPSRASEARLNILAAQKSNQIPSHVTIEIKVANALDTTIVDYTKATVVFLYLVPRGLRLIKDIVWSNGNVVNRGGRGCCSEEKSRCKEETQQPLVMPTSESQPEQEMKTGTHRATTIEASNKNADQRDNERRPRRIITYMAPFENTPHVQKEYCKVEHQEGAAWPVYLYHVV